MDCSTPGLPVPHDLLKFAQVHVHCISDAIQPSHPDALLSLWPQSFPASGTFSMSCYCIRWPKYWSFFSFSISPSNEYSGLISFKTNCFDLLAVQGTLRCLLQHHSSKASILCHSAFFTAQLSQPFMPTGKIIALTIQAFVRRVMSLLFNTLSRFAIAFLPINKCLLISYSCLENPMDGGAW